MTMRSLADGEAEADEAPYYQQLKHLFAPLLRFCSVRKPPGGPCVIFRWMYSLRASRCPDLLQATDGLAKRQTPK